MNKNIKFYNSLTRQKEDFVPIEGNNVKMYACGITPSAEAHIGHLYQALIYDIMRKFLVKEGYNVVYARNYTDVDDKIIAKSNELHIPANEYAEKMIEKIDKEMHAFQIGEPDIWLYATKTIGDMIKFISKLIEKDKAYATPNGDVYFSVDKFKEYGKLSGRRTEEALDGVRIENDEFKKSPLDFALWKSAKEGEPYWDSPWGKGRPGWHIECSVMNYVTFGEQIDIHGGGRDLLFPHHENEIAQTESLTGKPFAKYWIHNGLIRVNGQKMSKSLGNSLLMKDLRKEYHIEVIKLALLQNSYHTDINITDKLFEDSEKHLYNFYTILNDAQKKFCKFSGNDEKVENNFDDAMRDDLNTSKAISYLFNIFKEAREKLQNNDRSVMALLNSVIITYSLLGLFKESPEKFIAKVDEKTKLDIPDEVKALAEKRWQAKKDRDFKLADGLREEIQKLGYLVKDTRDGYDLNKI
ncbi:MAG TPA: cysteine--tRNA ligase [Candidatus Caccovivens faecavium]|nr:cysteine--tRNA ligase [Candidatus Caccovivens faecavium]